MAEFKRTWVVGFALALCLGLGACDEKVPQGVAGGLRATPPERPVSEPERPREPEVIPDLQGVRKLWTASRQDRRVSAVDLDTGKILVQTLIAGEPTALSADEELLWVATDEGKLIQLSATSGDVVKTLSTGGEVQALLLSKGALWVAILPGAGAREARTPELLRLDAESGEKRASIPLGTMGDSFGGLSEDSQGVWVLLNHHSALYRVDPVTDLATSVEIPGQGVFGRSSIVADEGMIWLFDRDQGRLVAFSEASGSDHSMSALKMNTESEIDRRIEPSVLRTPFGLVFLHRVRSSIYFQRRGEKSFREIALSSAPTAAVFSDSKLYVSLEPRHGSEAGLLVEIDLANSPRIERSFSGIDADLLAGSDDSKSVEVLDSLPLR